MATHDYVIDNSTGANVRADINSVLQAILTNNSSSSAPSTTAAYMFWADTTTGTLKIRNSSNNAWVELLQLDGTITLEDGSASAPALANRGDLDTGVFFGAANQFNIATGGVERVKIDSTAVIFNESGADVDFRVESDGRTHMLFVDAGNNRVGLGCSSPNSEVVVQGSAHSNLQVWSGSASTKGFLQTSQDTDVRIGSSTSHPLVFYTAGNVAAQFDTSGNLGIGTSSPTGRLNLAVGASTACVLRLTSNNTGSGAGDRGRIEVFSAQNNGTAFEAGQIVIDRTSTTLSKAKFQLFLNNDAGVEKAFEILPDGKTSFNGSSATNCDIDIDGNQVDIGNPLGNSVGNGIYPTFRALVVNKSILFSSMWGGDNVVHKQLEFSGGNRIVYDGTSDNEMARFTGDDFLVGTTSNSSASSVGLKLNFGTTNPTFNTVINQATGNHSFYHLYNINGTHNGYRFYVQVNGGIANHSGNNVNLSDERMKKNITNMGSVYSIFKQFVFRDFNYIDDEASESKKHGVIAQEVETIDADLITDDFKIGGDKDENYVYRKALKEEQFMMIGLKALQEAIAKIEVLETKVAALESA